MEIANLIHFVLIGIESLILMSKLSLKISIKLKAKAKAKAAEKKDFQLYKSWKKSLENRDKNNEQ